MNRQILVLMRMLGLLSLCNLGRLGADIMSTEPGYSLIEQTRIGLAQNDSDFEEEVEEVPVESEQEEIDGGDDEGEEPRQQATPKTGPLLVVNQVAESSSPGCSWYSQLLTTLMRLRA